MLPSGCDHNGSASHNRGACGAMLRMRPAVPFPLLRVYLFNLFLGWVGNCDLGALAKVHLSDLLESPSLKFVSFAWTPNW